MIIVLLGKSGAGKDAIQNQLVEDGFERIVTCTTRPMREGEVEGKDYFFLSRNEFENKLLENDIIEYRTYKTLVDNNPDIWYYGTPKQELDNEKDYVIILDKEGAENFIDYYGSNDCFTVYVDLDDDTRTKRAMARGSFNMSEWQRRLADDNDKFKDMSVFADYTIVNNRTVREATSDIEIAFYNSTRIKRFGIEDIMFEKESVLNSFSLEDNSDLDLEIG